MWDLISFSRISIETFRHVVGLFQVNYYARHLHTTNDAPSTVSTASAAAGNEALAGNGLSGASFVFANFNKVTPIVLI
jgi:hypothetical protein